MFQRLGGLDAAHQPGHRTQHAGLGAVRHHPRRRRRRKQAPIAALAGDKHRGLPVESQNAAIHQRLAQQIAGIVDQIPGGEVVSPVDHQIILPDDVHGVFRIKPGFVQHHIDVGVVGFDVVVGRLHLGPAHIGGMVQHLALQVGQIHHIQIHDADRPHAGQRQIDGARRAQPAGADNQGAGLHQRPLPAGADIAHNDMPAIAFDLFRGKRQGLGSHSKIPPNRPKAATIGPNPNRAGRSPRKSGATPKQKTCRRPDRATPQAERAQVSAKNNANPPPMPGARYRSNGNPKSATSFARQSSAAPSGCQG